ncbi:hypothetical protein L1987_38909 [Smallanthus sonchifolius]|uniref:Uncharacterized protein n=1 Tax=Smallanthus sonchifolius TaxID=185202 RepID=A0ACB9HN18_9ASTR|nr:hypothetical protein L1987_38909 [Smallanthus sonchifolius]
MVQEGKRLHQKVQEGKTLQLEVTVETATEGSGCHGSGGKEVSNEGCCVLAGEPGASEFYEEYDDCGD